MSLPLILALNIGIATLLTLALALVMVGPSRFRPHHRPHSHADRAPRRSSGGAQMLPPLPINRFRSDAETWLSIIRNRRFHSA